MTAQEPVPFHKLGTADLVVDRLFDGGLQGHTSDDPIAQLLPVGNQGGFRYKGSPERGSVRLVVLYTTGAEPDWPDSLDLQTGIFTYYGDNKRPGHELHDTRRKGNLLLKSVFELTNGTAEDRLQVPPFLLFEKTGPGRRVAFRGLLAPGAASLTADDELTAIWRSGGGSRFQNYRSRFTVLDAPEVSRAWIDDILAGKTNESIHRPDSWTAWVDGRNYRSLTAPPTTTVRSREDQLPDDASGCEILNTIRNHYRGNEHAFEACASEIWRLTAPRTTHCELTRPTVDGGRDAIGEYAIGPASDPITIKFALEAKCYDPSNAIGVQPLARLISRIRHRQFGVFVTLSYYNKQVYKEVRDDGHPIVLISGKDIVDTLKSHGYTDPKRVENWLATISR